VLALDVLRVALAQWVLIRIEMTRGSQGHVLCRGDPAESSNGGGGCFGT
jgi:hypothetical protein